MYVYIYIYTLWKIEGGGAHGAEWCRGGSETSHLNSLTAQAMEVGTLRRSKDGLCALCYAKAALQCSKCKQRWRSGGEARRRSMRAKTTFGPKDIRVQCLVL